MAPVLQEILAVHSDDSGLVGLGHISEDHVDHGHEHSVFLVKGVPRGFLASATNGITLVLFLAIFTKSLPDLGENSTAYTIPS